MEILIVAVLAIVFTLAIQYVTGVFEDDEPTSSSGAGSGDEGEPPLPKFD